MLVCAVAFSAVSLFFFPFKFVSWRCLPTEWWYQSTFHQSLEIHSLMENEVGHGDPWLNYGPEATFVPELRFTQILFPWPSRHFPNYCVRIWFYNIVLNMLNDVSLLVRENCFSAAFVRTAVSQEEKIWWNCLYSTYLWQLKVLRTHKGSAGISALGWHTWSLNLWKVFIFIFHLHYDFS